MTPAAEKIIVGFTGRKRSGKDTAASYLTDFGFHQLAFADALRATALGSDPYVRIAGSTHDQAQQLILEADFMRLTDVIDSVGWEVAKDAFPDVRRYLERLATEGVRDSLAQDSWINVVMRQAVSEEHSKVVISDVRFVDEALAIRQAGGIIVRIESERSGETTGHISDQGIPAELCDAFVRNEYDDTFRQSVFNAVNDAWDNRT